MVIYPSSVTTATIADFTCIESHPYGVLPGGNGYFEQPDNTAPGSTTTSSLNLLEDELWQNIFQFCDGMSLGLLVQTCRHFYVAGHQPELWRDLVLKKESLLDSFCQTWKDTFVQLHCIKNQTASVAAPHVPLAVQGVYSDHYYRTHLCRSFSIPDSWMQPTITTSTNVGTVDRVCNISMNDFLTKYEEVNKPCVLAGVAKSWKAFHKWNSLDYLATMTKGRHFRATSGAAPFPAQFSLQSYSQYSSCTMLEESPLYLFDRTALIGTSSLHDDYFPDMQRTCPYFDPTQDHHDLFSLLGSQERPDHTWLIVGPKRSGSAFHLDPNATHAWNAAICGRKRWIFYPPGCTPPGVHPSPNGDVVAMPISLGEWILNYWDDHVVRCTTGHVATRPMECTVEAGDVVFVPHGWWHLVINLDEVNIAVTHNYVSKSNLPTVLRFLQQKEEQISGCRDREESIKPKDLYAEFCKVLRLRHAEWLDEAQEKANQGWSCAAWTDDTKEEQQDKARKKKLFVNGKRRRCDEESNASIMSKAKTAQGSDSPTESSGFSFSFL